jgi:hypothetical protein
MATAAASCGVSLYPGPNFTNPMTLVYAGLIPITSTPSLNALLPNSCRKVEYAIIETFRLVFLLRPDFFLSRSRFSMTIGIKLSLAYRTADVTASPSIAPVDSLKNVTEEKKIDS